jgi:hypothetical protein
MKGPKYPYQPKIKKSIGIGVEMGTFDRRRPLAQLLDGMPISEYN